MDRVNEIERMLLGLAERTRLRILYILKDGEVTVSTITKHLGLAQPKVSRHLAYLKDSGIASARRDGKQIFYRLADHLHASSIVMAVVRELDHAAADNSRYATEMTVNRSTQPHTTRHEDDMETYLL